MVKKRFVLGYVLGCRSVALALVLVCLVSECLFGASVRLTCPPGFRTGVPYPVRVDVLDAQGLPDLTNWEAEATLTTTNGNALLSTNRVLLRNGVGSVLLSVQSPSGFTLEAKVGAMVATRTVVSLDGRTPLQVGGGLSGANTVWSGVVLVTNTVTIPVGHQLTIQPGTLVMVAGASSGTAAAGFQVNGKIQCLGTALEPITITTASESLNWGQIRHDSSDASTYSYTFVNKAGRAPGEGHTGSAPLLRLSNSSLVLDHCVLSDLRDGDERIGKSMMANGSSLFVTDTVFARSRMGPEIAGTQLLCTNSFFMDMNGPDDADGIYLHDANGKALVLSRCVMAGGDDDAVDTMAADAVIENCVMRDWPNPNEDAKGVSVFHGSVLLRRCLIANCFMAVSAKSSGALSAVQIDACTIQGITRGVSAAWKANATVGNIQITITNSIVLSADALHSDFGADKFSVVAYCDASEAWPGLGNISADPLFVDPSRGDYRLLPGSPCINAGDPASPLDSDGSRADIGCYGVGSWPSAIFVALTSPRPGSLFIAPTNLTVTAVAHASQDTVSAVDFYARTQWLGRSTSQPYTFSWSIQRVGAYDLTAVAETTAGVRATSAPVVITVGTGTFPTSNVLVTAQSVWKYLDDGSNQGTNWYSPEFNDSLWPSGPAKLGYGDGNEATVLSFGTNPASKHVTYYFRHAFVFGGGNVNSLTLRLWRDDGAVVFLNGREAYRVGMPSGDLTYRTYATNSSDYSWVSASLDSALLRDGTNILAVEVHQGSATSSDMGLDLELTAVVRAATNARPFVQITSPVDGRTFSEGSAVAISASAFDVDGDVSDVAFQVDGIKVGQDAIPPYEFQWRPSSVGTFALAAVANDDAGLSTTSAVVRILVSTNSAPPLITQRTPSSGPVTNLNRVVVIFDKAVTGVDATDLLLDGVPARKVSGNGVEFTFEFAPPPAGLLKLTWAPTHGITDTFVPPNAFDAMSSGAAWELMCIDTVPPLVYKTSPRLGEVVPVLTNVVVLFNEAVVGVDAADLTLGGQPATRVTGTGAGPYTFEFILQPSGSATVQWNANHGITDVGGNALKPNGWSFEVDSKNVRLVISEIHYHPSSENRLEEYIEFFNAEPGPVNLEGWTISDGVDFSFENVTVPGGGYVVVAADLATFKALYPGVTNVVGNWTGTLSNSGEEIELRNERGERVTSVTYADEGEWAVRQRSLPTAGQRGWTWFAEHDGLGKSLELVNLQMPLQSGQNWAASLPFGGTPGRSNSVASSTSPPHISQVAHAPLVPSSTSPVTIRAYVQDETHAPVAVRLHYRVDGPTLTEFIIAEMNDQGIGGDSVSGDRFFAATVPSQTNNVVVEFFVSATDIDGMTRFWPAPAIRSADGLGPEGQVANALYQVDDSYYSGPQPIYRIVMKESERAQLAAIMDNVNLSAGSDAQMNATFISSDGTGTQVRYLASARNRGHGTRVAKPNNFRVGFRSDEKWKGVSALNLNAQFSWLQVLGAAIHTRAQSLGAYSQPVQLRVNNANLVYAGPIDRTYGSYAANEAIDSDWADRHFPNDGEGNVYRALRDLSPSDFDYRSLSAYPILYGGESRDSYTNTWFKETNASEDDWTDLIGMLRTFGLSGTELFTTESVRRVVNVEQWMRYLAMMNLLGSSETSLNSGYNDDYMLYRGIDDPRFMLLYYDLDQILGFNRGFAPDASIFSAAASGSGRGSAAAFNRFLHHPDFEPIYFAALRQLIDGALSAEQFEPLVDEVLGSFVPDTVRSQIKTWMAQRRAYVLQQLPPPTPAPRAIVTGIPRSPTPLTSATFTVGGTGVTTFRYSLNGAGYGESAPSNVPLVLSNLRQGTNALSVLGKGAAGPEQGMNSPTTLTWVVDTNWPGVRLNEIVANGAQSQPDAIELFNEGPNPVTLGGIGLSDRAGQPHKYVIGSVVLGSGEYILFNAQQLGFSLDASGEGVYLSSPASEGGRLLDQVEFGQQLVGYSVGRAGRSGEWRLTSPTFGSANMLAAVALPNQVRINEWLAFGAGAFPEDFIELHNPASLAVDIGGCFLSDQPIGAPAMARIRPLSFISPGGFHVMGGGNEANAPLPFNLDSNAGEIALFDAESNSIHSIFYGAQSTGRSSGSCPDAAFHVSSGLTPTPGSGNACLLPPSPNGTTNVVINELLANNRSLPDAHGSRADWIELYNGSASPSDVGGMSLSDDPSIPRKWELPPGTVIPARGYLRIACDGGRPASSTNTGFGLSSNSGSVYLHDKSQAGGGLRDSIVYGLQAADWSIGRVPDGVQNWVLALPSGGAPNTAATLGDPRKISINEWMADPASGGDWFELFNQNLEPVSLEGLAVSDSLTSPTLHPFPPRSFIGNGDGAFIVLFADQDLAAGADHVNFRMSAAGERIVLATSTGMVLKAVNFGPQARGVSQGVLPDGTSSVLSFPDSSSPGFANFLPLSTIVINELLSHSEEPFEDAVELHNTTDDGIDISGWFLSDSSANPRKFQVPSGFIVPARGYAVLYEEQFNSEASAEPFSFSSIKPEQAVLSAAINGILTGERAVATLRAADRNQSLGRVLTSRGPRFVALRDTSFGVEFPTTIGEFKLGRGVKNGYPQVGPVVISEIMYHPLGTNDALEFLELYNASPDTVSLFDALSTNLTWRLRGGISFDFSPGASIPGFSAIILVSFDPANNVSARAAFTTAYGNSARLVGPYSGKLDNSGEAVELLKPGTARASAPGADAETSYIAVDRVEYMDSAPWPGSADGTGKSLQRIAPGLFADEPLNWIAATPTPGILDFDKDHLPDPWELVHGLLSSNAADANLDSDGDGMSNYLEFVAGTSPRDSQSALICSVFVVDGICQLSVQGVAGKEYFIEACANLSPDAWYQLTRVPALAADESLIFLLPRTSSTLYFRVRAQ